MSNIYSEIAKKIVDAIKDHNDEKNDICGSVEKTVVFKPIEISEDTSLEDVTKTIADYISTAFVDNKFDKCVLNIAKEISGTAGITSKAGITGKAGETKTVGETKKANSISGTITKEEMEEAEDKEILKQMRKISSELDVISKNFKDIKERHLAHKEEMKSDIIHNNKLIENVRNHIKKINEIKEDYANDKSEKCCCEKKELSVTMLAAKLSRYNPEWVYGDCIKVANELLKNYTIIRK